MATIIQTTEYVVCDMHGSQEVDAPTQREFSQDGKTYVLDLCDVHAAKFDAALQPFKDNGAVHGGPSSGKTKPKQATSTSNGHVSFNDVREWAKKNGIKGVAPQGRIKQEIVDQYKAEMLQHQ